MTPVAEAEPAAAPREKGKTRDVAAKQIRGSSLLLAGKLLSIGGKFGAQVLIVRHLSTADYGAWAYALSVVVFLGSFAHLSLDRAVSRFAAIYHERQDYDRFFGTLLLVTGALALTGVAFATAFHAFPGYVTPLLGDQAESIALLLILIFLVPLEGLDALLIAIFATFGRSRAIFFRRHLFTPLMQLSIVALLVGFQADVTFLAYGYLLGTLLGVMLSAWMLIGVMRQQGLITRFWTSRPTVPWRELLTFCVPLMTSDWLTASMQASGTLALGHLYDTEEIAMLRVVIPVVMLNHVVMQSFQLLYVPTAARLFAKGDSEGVQDLYWRTTLWIAVLTFPIFAITFVAATPLTSLLFGARYEAAGTILSILAIGHYVHASLGFNGMTLKVMGKVRYIVVSNLFMALLNVLLTLALVPRYGAVGAALSMASTMVIHNIVKQAGLRITAGFNLWDHRYSRPFLIIAAGAAALVAVSLFDIRQLPILALVAAGLSFVVLRRTRGMLRLGDVFPEVTKLPLLKGLLT